MYRRDLTLRCMTGTGDDLKLYQGGDWAGIIDKIPYLKGMGSYGCLDFGSLRKS